MKTKRKDKEKKKKRKQKKRTGKGSAPYRTQDLRRTGPKLYHKATWNTQEINSKFYYYNLRTFRPIRYKLVCEQNVFCHRDVPSYVKANYPKSLPFALKVL